MINVEIWTVNNTTDDAEQVCDKLRINYSTDLMLQYSS